MAVHDFDDFKMEKDVEPSGLKYIDIPKMSFKVSVTIDDKINKQIVSDAILIEEMHDEVKKVYKQNCDSIKSKFVAFDKLFVTWIDQGMTKKDIDKHVDGLNKSIKADIDVGEKAAEMVVDACWKKYIKTKKEYTKYKIKIAANIAAAAAGLVSGIVLMATTPFTGGASFAFGIIGMAKSVVTIAKEIRSAWADIETAQGRLEADIGVIENLGKALTKANEFSAAVFKQFAGASQPSIKSCSSQTDIIVKKLAGIEVNTHEASKILNQMLDDVGNLKKDFMAEVRQKYQKMVGRIPSGQIKDIEKELDVQLTPGEQEIEAQIAHVQSMYVYFKSAEKKTETLKKKVEEIEGLRTIDVKIFENILSLVDIPLAILDGNAIGKAKSLESGLAQAGTFFAFDKISSKVLDGTILA